MYVSGSTGCLSLYICFCLSLFLFLPLSLALSLCLAVALLVPLCLFDSVSVSLLPRLSRRSSLFFYVSLSLSLSLSFCLSFYFYFYVSISICLPDCLYGCLSVRPSSIHPSIHIYSICLAESKTHLPFIQTHFSFKMFQHVLCTCSCSATTALAIPLFA